MITCCGRNRVERKVHLSKSSVTVMFSGIADGTYLPSMVVYKSENIYREWVRGCCDDTVYLCTKSGWIKPATFQTWFFKQSVPPTQ